MRACAAGNCPFERIVLSAIASRGVSFGTSFFARRRKHVNATNATTHTAQNVPARMGRSFVLPFVGMMAVLPLAPVVCGDAATLVLVVGNAVDAVGIPDGIGGTVKAITGESSISSSSGKTVGVASVLLAGKGKGVGGSSAGVGSGIGGVTHSHQPSTVEVVLLSSTEPFVGTAGVRYVTVAVAVAVVAMVAVAVAVAVAVVAVEVAGAGAVVVVSNVDVVAVV